MTVIEAGPGTRTVHRDCSQVRRYGSLRMGSPSQEADCREQERMTDRMTEKKEMSHRQRVTNREGQRPREREKGCECMALSAA